MLNYRFPTYSWFYYHIGIKVSVTFYHCDSLREEWVVCTCGFRDFSPPPTLAPLLLGLWKGRKTMQERLYGSCFSQCIGQILDKKQVKGGRIYLGFWLEGTQSIMVTEAQADGKFHCTCSQKADSRPEQGRAVKTTHSHPLPQVRLHCLQVPEPFKEAPLAEKQVCHKPVRKMSHSDPNRCEWRMAFTTGWQETQFERGRVWGQDKLFKDTHPGPTS